MSTSQGGSGTAADKEIANRIGNALIIKNVTAKDVAAKADINYKRLLTSLKGDRSLTVVEFRKIAGAIGVKPSELLPDEVAA